MAAAGCAAAREPILFPNNHLERVGSANARAEVLDCEGLAEQYTENSSEYREVGKSGLIGGAVGAGTGALAGAIMKDNVGRATGAGAAVGGVLGVLSGLRDRGTQSPSYRQFVEYCLEKRGYEVAGWR